LIGKTLVIKASAATKNKTENPIAGETRSTPSIRGPNKPAIAAEPAVLKFASPKKRADSFLGTRSAISAQLPPAKAADPMDINPPNNRIWLVLPAQISINALTDMVAKAAGITIKKRHVPGPQGVRGRNSDNSRLRQVLGWEPTVSLEIGLARTYLWIEAELARAGRLRIAA